MTRSHLPVSDTRKNNLEYLLASVGELVLTMDILVVGVPATFIIPITVSSVLLIVKHVDSTNDGVGLIIPVLLTIGLTKVLIPEIGA